MSRPRGRPNRKNAMDRENSEDILLEASSLLHPEMQGARRRLLSPIDNEDYTLPMSSSQTGAITQNMERRRTLQEELGAMTDQPTNKEIEESVKNGSMEERYEELKLAFNDMRLENRQLQNRLDAAERRMDAFTNLLQEQIEDLENKIHSQVTEQVRSLRNMNEVRFQVLEGRLDDYRDREAISNEQEVRRNADNIRRITDRQQRFEEALNQRNPHLPETSTSNETLKITPRTPVFNGKGSPIKFLEELSDFWAAIRPSRGQTAFVISSCLQGTPKDWWDLVKEENDDLSQFIGKFKRRYWGEETQHAIKATLEFGNYQPSTDPSMVAYAIKIFREVKGLVPSPTTKEIISKLARHFNEEIRSTILARPINTLEDLLELLERFDNAGPLNSRRLTPPIPHDSWRIRSPRDYPQYPRFSDDRGHPQRRNPGIPDGQPKNENWRKPARNQEQPQNNVRVLDMIGTEQADPPDVSSDLNSPGNE